MFTHWTISLLALVFILVVGGEGRIILLALTYTPATPVNSPQKNARQRHKAGGQALQTTE